MLIDGADHPLPVFGEKLGAATQHALEKLEVEVRSRTMVTDIDATSVTVKDADGNIERIDSLCKVWAAGVQGSELGAILAKQTGVELDRAGRVIVAPDLTIPGHREIFVIGDLMSVPGVPGVAQGAIQSAHFIADQIRARITGRSPKSSEFVYKDKGSMATISRFQAVASLGKMKLTGFTAWLAWCFLHLLYIVGFKAQIGTLIHWFISFASNARSERTTTNQQMVGRLALSELGTGSSGRLVAGEHPATSSHESSDK
ncbi:MAG: hypothetical protein CSA82_02425 [Actinobacteria bacterium]|nr:MAG: hypothetical protein CSA82_02425 [Actinomycetota bacterium]